MGEGEGGGNLGDFFTPSEALREEPHYEGFPPFFVPKGSDRLLGLYGNNGREFVAFSL
jgi:hypothetical protein